MSRSPVAGTVVFVSVGLTLMLVLATTALAYKKRINPVDQVAAEHTLLRLADLPTTATWTGGKVEPDDSQLSCPGYKPKASDLVETGQASSRFNAPGLEIESDVNLLATPKMVAVDWKRTFIPKLVPCLRQVFAEGGQGKLTDLSARRLAFPNLATHTAAYRVSYLTTVNGKPTRGVIDLIAMDGNRTEASLVLVAMVGPPAEAAAGEASAAALDRQLAQILARRAGFH